MTNKSNDKLIISFLFFLSGFTALVYEVAWLNRIQLIMGHTTYALVTVLSAYLIGLALGSLYSRKLINKKINTFNIYITFELLIGIYGLLFYPLLKMFQYFYDGMISPELPLPLLSSIHFLFAGALVIIPTILMGATLPLLSSYLYKTKEELSLNISALYGINTLGAFFGCLFTGYFILPSIGYRNTILLCAVINLFIFFLATNKISIFSFPRWQDLLIFNNSLPKTHKAFNRSDYFYLSTIFTSGLCSIGIQVLWNRYTSLLYGGTVFTFTLVTSVVLLGICLGSYWVQRKLKSAINHEKDLVLLLICSAITILLGSHIFASSGLTVLFWHQYFDTTNFIFTILQFTLILACLLPGATLLGCLFPYALSLFLKDKNDGSDKVAICYALNIGGIVIGSILVTFVIIPISGIEGLKNILPLLLILVTVPYSRLARQSWINTLGLFTIGFLLVYIIPSVEKEVLTQGYFYNRIKKQTSKELEKRGYTDWKSYYKSKRNKLLDYKDDIHATISIHSYYNRKDRIWFKINGKVDGNTSPRDLKTVRILPLVPLLIRTDYEDILTIGLGTGETANITANFPNMKSSEVVELSPAQISFSKTYYTKYNNHIFNDKRFKVINRDGREYLEHTKKKYDLIISEPSNPWQNGVGSLFTTEFFKTMSSKLKPKGIASIWLHLYGLECSAIESVALATARNFKYVAVFRYETDLLFISSNENTFTNKKLPDSLNKLEKLLFDSLGTDLKNITREKAYQKISKMWLMDSGRILKYDGKNALVNTDDNQYLQYSSAKTYWRDFGCPKIFDSN
jgi:spermidine synthase